MFIRTRVALYVDLDKIWVAAEKLQEPLHFWCETSIDFDSNRINFIMYGVSF